MRRLRKGLSWCLAVLATVSLLGSCGQDRPMQSVTKDTVIVSKGDFVYFVTPLRDLASQDRVDAVMQAKSDLFSRIQKVYPKSDMVNYSKDFMDAKEEELTPIVRGVGDYLRDNEAGIRDMGFAVSDLIPSAFMLLVGGKLSGNYGIGGAGSLSLGAVVIPFKVARINKRTHEVKENFVFRWSLIGVPVVELGVGIGGGPTWHGGVGFIWGEMTDPKVFGGKIEGVSGSFKTGFGHNLKLGLVRSNTAGRDLYFASAVLQTGPGGELHFHGFRGNVFLLDDLMKRLGFMNGDFGALLEDAFSPKNQPDRETEIEVEG